MLCGLQIHPLMLSHVQRRIHAMCLWWKYKDINGKSQRTDSKALVCKL